MATTLRSSVDTVIADAGRAFGTFAGLLSVCLLGGLLVARVAALASTELAGPTELGLATAFVVAALGTMWLEDGGYERFGADPDGGPTFAWLAIVAVPLATLPARYALGLLIGSGALDPLFALPTTLFAGWLAFYGGFERLDLTASDIDRVAGSVVAFGAVPVGIAALFDASWLLEDRVAATVAMGVQFAACWLGFATDAS